MKKFFLLMTVFCVLACSVKATKTEPRQTAPQQKEATTAAPKKETPEEQLRRIGRVADPIIENILTAINKDDYKAYIRDFNDAMKSAYHDQKQFKKDNSWRKSRIGEYATRNIWKIDKEYQYYIVYYRVKFSKTPDPVTIRMTLEKNESGNLQVAFLQYISPALEKTK